MVIKPIIPPAAPVWPYHPIAGRAKGSLCFSCFALGQRPSAEGTAPTIYTG
jgi:hypothetical protein